MFKLFLSFILLMCTASIAFASDGATFTINFQEHLSELVTAVILLLGSATTFLVHRAYTLLGLDKDSKIRQYLDDALYNALTFAQGYINENGSKYIGDVQTRHEILAIATNYVLKQVPDAVKHFNIGDKDLRDMLYARLEQVNPNAVSSNADVG